MRLIDADKVKIESRKHCIDCTLNGTKQCKTCVINLICDRLDLQPTIAQTDRPLAIINDKVIYMTEGHVNALLEYEQKQAVQIAVDQLKRDIVAVQEWENDYGKK